MEIEDKIKYDLRILKQTNKWTDEDISKFSGTSRSFIAAVMSGKKKTPDKLLVKFAEIVIQKKVK